MTYLLKDLQTDRHGQVLEILAHLKSTSVIEKCKDKYRRILGTNQITKTILGLGAGYAGVKAILKLAAGQQQGWEMHPHSDAGGCGQIW